MRLERARLRFPAVLVLDVDGCIEVPARPVITAGERDLAARIRGQVLDLLVVGLDSGALIVDVDRVRAAQLPHCIGHRDREVGRRVGRDVGVLVSLLRRRDDGYVMVDLERGRRHRAREERLRGGRVGGVGIDGGLEADALRRVVIRAVREEMQDRSGCGCLGLALPDRQANLLPVIVLGAVRRGEPDVGEGIRSASRTHLGRQEDRHVVVVPRLGKLHVDRGTGHVVRGRGDNAAHGVEDDGNGRRRRRDHRQGTHREVRDERPRTVVDVRGRVGHVDFRGLAHLAGLRADREMRDVIALDHRDLRDLALHTVPERILVTVLDLGHRRILRPHVVRIGARGAAGNREARHGRGRRGGAGGDVAPHAAGLVRVGGVEVDGLDLDVRAREVVVAHFRRLEFARVRVGEGFRAEVELKLVGGHVVDRILREETPEVLLREEVVARLGRRVRIGGVGLHRGTRTARIRELEGQREVAGLHRIAADEVGVVEARLAFGTLPRHDVRIAQTAAHAQTDLREALLDRARTEERTQHPRVHVGGIGIRLLPLAVRETDLELHLVARHERLRKVVHHADFAQRVPVEFDRPYVTGRRRHAREGTRERRQRRREKSKRSSVLHTASFC